MRKTDGADGRQKQRLIIFMSGREKHLTSGGASGAVCNCVRRSAGDMLSQICRLTSSVRRNRRSFGTGRGDRRGGETRTLPRRQPDSCGSFRD